MYVGDGLLAEFSISETGGIDGREGDQTGREACIHDYYNYPWDCILRYTKARAYDIQDAGDVNAVFTYRVRTREDGWLPEVRNLEDYAGIPGHAITDVAIKVSCGSLSYKVRDKSSKQWYEPVSGYDIKDNEHGYAGDSREIDLISVYWCSPSGRRSAKYRVAPVGGEYFPWQYDTDTDNGQDGFAGDTEDDQTDNRSIDRFQICVS